MAIRLGLIARSEVARGIALQSRNFYDHMPVDDVLLVRMPRPDCKEAPEWYPGATHAAYDPIRHQLDEELVTDWLEGLDVVFTVETPNDWRMPLWCREMGVKLVIQGNPEFVRHGREGFEHLAHPDQWWWPTKWRTDILPAGVHMPVPMPDTVPVERNDDDVPLRVLHVVGKRAYADRNGTEILVSALRRVRRKMHVTIIGLDGELPKVQAGPSNRNLTVEYHPDGFDNHWDMYRNQDVLVTPRRYGGLQLPALEAAACGLAVMMPDCSPNAELASVLVPVRRQATLSLAAGTIRTAEVAPLDLSEHLDRLAWDRNSLIQAKDTSQALVPRWSMWRQRYLDRLQEVVSR